MEVISMQEAGRAGLKYFFNGIPCRHGHTDKRLVSSGACAPCQVIRMKTWCIKNRQRKLDLDKNWRDNHPERMRELSLLRRPYQKANGARRRALQTNATPKWANHAEIMAIYEEATRRTNATGVKWVVDHWAPLRGKLVCGLHVAANLDIITEDDNARKLNSFDPMNPPKWHRDEYYSILRPTLNAKKPPSSA